MAPFSDEYLFVEIANKVLTHGIDDSVNFVVSSAYL